MDGMWKRNCQWYILLHIIHACQWGMHAIWAFSEPSVYIIVNYDVLFFFFSQLYSRVGWWGKGGIQHSTPYVYTVGLDCRLRPLLCLPWLMRVTITDRQTNLMGWSSGENISYIAALPSKHTINIPPPTFLFFSILCTYSAIIYVHIMRRHGC